MILPLFLSLAALAPTQRDEAAVTWRGGLVLASELEAELGEAPALAVRAWADWSGEHGYTMHLDDTGRVLWVGTGTPAVTARRLLHVAATVELFDQVLPAPEREDPEARPSDPEPEGLPEDPDGPPAGWAPVDLPELPWEFEWGDDGAAPDTETCVLFALRNESDYSRLLDELGEKQDYLKPWLPTAKGYTGFVLERPLAGAYIVSAEGQEEWNPDHEVVNRVTQLLFTRRFSQQPYWLVQGVAWQIEFRLLEAIYCFPYRDGFVFATEHTAWKEDLRKMFLRRKHDPLVYGEFTRMERGKYDPKVARISFGFLGFLIDQHGEELSGFIEALRVFREENNKIDNEDGTWKRSLTYQVPSAEQARLLEERFGATLLVDAGEFFRTGEEAGKKRRK